MNGQLTSRRVALALLTVSALALLVGLFNAARLAQEATERRDIEMKGKSVATLLSNRKAHLALIELTGMITMQSGNDKGLFSSESNAVLARKALDAAAKDNSVKGVLLHIDSPGGTIAMSQELNAAVTRVSKKKPVVVSMGDLAASGGYYTACAADYIVANRGTLTASIGVIISSLDFSGLMHDKLGVQPVTIKSGRFKDILSPYRKPTPADLSLLQNLVDHSYQDFLNIVTTSRTRFLKTEKERQARIASIKSVADGRVVSGQDALRAGLVDELGDLDLAYTRLDAMAKERASIHRKERLPLEENTGPSTLWELLGFGSSSQLGSGKADLTAKMLPLSMQYPNQPLWVME